MRVWHVLYLAWVWHVIKFVTHSTPDTKLYKICQLRMVKFFAFYKISQLNFASILILVRYFDVEFAYSSHPEIKRGIERECQILKITFSYLCRSLNLRILRNRKKPLSLKEARNRLNLHSIITTWISILKYTGSSLSW